MSTDYNPYTHHDPVEDIRISDIPSHISDAAKSHIDLYKAMGTQAAASTASGAASGILLAILGLITLLFASVAGALAIGKELDNTALGFLIVAGAYLLLVLVILFLGGPLIKNPISNLIIRTVYSEAKPTRAIEKDDHKTKN